MHEHGWNQVFYFDYSRVLPASHLVSTYFYGGRVAGCRVCCVVYGCWASGLLGAGSEYWPSDEKDGSKDAERCRVGVLVVFVIATVVACCLS